MIRDRRRVKLPTLSWEEYAILHDRYVINAGESETRNEREEAKLRMLLIRAEWDE